MDRLQAVLIKKYCKDILGYSVSKEGSIEINQRHKKKQENQWKKNKNMN